MSFCTNHHRQDIPVYTSRSAVTLENHDEIGSSQSPIRRALSAINIVRRPFHLNPSEPIMNGILDHALNNRYRYYSRLDPRSDTSLRMPDHVTPINYFSILPFDNGKGKQNSLLTIFSIWNAMVGSSLLTMPWALNQAGFVLGMAVFLILPFIAFYTAYLVIESPKGLDLSSSNFDLPDIYGYFWGKRAEKLSSAFTIWAFIGALIVYYVLMSNFMFDTGTVIIDSLILEIDGPQALTKMQNTSQCGVICASNMTGTVPETETPVPLFYHSWRLTTVPLYLSVCILPLLMFSDAGFFQKFNGAGTVSVMYIIVYVIVKAVKCGVHMNFADETAVDYVKTTDSRAWSLTGTLTMSLFLHNSILNIIQHNEKQENNTRDLSVALVLTGLTYLVVGSVFYVAFPLPKSCIADNLLNNYLPNDILSSVARLFLLFQILTVFCLFSFLIRLHLFSVILGLDHIKTRWVLLLNCALLSICIFFAVFLPTVGNILRFVGAFTGLIYMFIMPNVVHLKKLQMEYGSVSKARIAFHGTIISFGIVNCIGQFLIF